MSELDCMDECVVDDQLIVAHARSIHGVLMEHDIYIPIYWSVLVGNPSCQLQFFVLDGIGFDETAEDHGGRKFEPEISSETNLGEDNKIFYVS